MPLINKFNPLPWTVEDGRVVHNPVGAPQIECCCADSFCTQSLCVQKSMHVESWVRFAGCRSCGLCVAVKLPNILFVGAFLVSGSQESPLRQVRRLSGSTTDVR